MRLELALVVGILLFCSWCAYIVARMGSSVNVPAGRGEDLHAPQPPPTQPPSQLHQQLHHQLINQTGQTPILIDHQALPMPERSYQQHYQQQQQQLTPPADAGLLQLQPMQQPEVVHHNFEQARQFDASEPVPARQLHYHWPGPQQPQQPPPPQPQPQPQPQPHYNQPLGGNNQWQAYALPTSLAEAGPRNQYEPRELSDDGQGADEEEEEAVEGEPAADYDPAQPEDGQQMTAASEDHARPQSSDEEEEEPADDYEAGPPERPQSELEEVSNARSYNELESDSNERDKDGNFVVTRRRHLINGRPVTPYELRQRRRRRQGPHKEPAEREPKPTASGGGKRREMSSNPRRKSPGGGSRKRPREEDEAEAEAEEAEEGAPASGSERDFEQMVREIDHEDKLRRAAEVAAKSSGGEQEAERRSSVPAPQQHERLVATNVTRADRREDPIGPQPSRAVQSASADRPANSSTTTKTSGPKTAARDSHQHRLQETLTAQQWDDDSTSMPDGGQEAASREEELRDDEDQDQVDNIVERDEEASQLARLSRNLLRESASLPEELERRKRQTRPFEGERAPEPGLIRDQRASQAERGAAEGDGDDLDGRDLPAPDLPDASDEDGAERGVVSDGDVNNKTTSAGLGSERRDARPAAVGGDSSPAARASTAPSPAPNVARDVEANRSVEAPAGRQMRWAAANGTDPSSAASQSLAGRVTDIVSGSEDMHVAVLASPPAAAAAQHHQQRQREAPLQQAANFPPAPLPPVMPPAVYGAPYAGPPTGYQPPAGAAHVASGSYKVGKRKKMRLKKKLAKTKRSKLVDSKHEAAKAYANKQKRRSKKGDLRKRKRKSEKDSTARRKHFEGLSKGKQAGSGHKERGAKKGSVFLKDKGYKKKGFKRSYHKLETGDHKTYFDEFRDKDHNKKWKDYDDKHKYSQRKKWAGYDSKRLDRHKLTQAKKKASKAGKWREKSGSKHASAADKYHASKKYGAARSSLKSSKKRKKAKKYHH